MACVSPDGTLTAQARIVLAGFASPHTPEEVAATTELALFRIRSSLRELVAAGLLEQVGDAYRTTAEGQQRLAQPAA
jgi:predicted transcriptional regulator